MKLHSFLALLLMSVPGMGKLAADRWGRATEEERHQLERAERYVDQKQFKSALTEYELFLQLYPTAEIASYAQLMIGECTRQNGDINHAINEFRTVIDKFRDSIDAGVADYSIGVCLTQTGDAEKAVLEFEKVIVKWPKEDFGALARNEACTIYWRLGQTEKWAAHMEYLAIGEYKDPKILRQLSQRRFLLHRLSEKKIAEAFALVKPGKGKDPLVIFSEWAAEAANNLPTIYGEKGKKDLPAIATDAVAFIEKKSTQMADPAQKSALGLSCARLYARAGLADKAKERFATLVKESPENDKYRMEYAAHLRAMGSRAEARLVYHDLRDQYVADTEIAATYAEDNNPKSCIEAYRTMLGKYADKASEIQWSLGKILQKTGTPKEAIAAYEQSQNEPDSLFRIAECQGALEQHDAAIQTLVGIMNFFRSAAPEAQYRTAAHYAAQGQKDKAISTLKTVGTMYLATSWAGKAHQDLAQIYGEDVTKGGAAKKIKQ